MEEVNRQRLADLRQQQEAERQRAIMEEYRKH
jgi:hypothetical protein